MRTHHPLRSVALGFQLLVDPPEEPFFEKARVLSEPRVGRTGLLDSPLLERELRDAEVLGDFIGGQEDGELAECHAPTVRGERR